VNNVSVCWNNLNRGYIAMIGNYHSLGVHTLHVSHRATAIIFHSIKVNISIMRKISSAFKWKSQNYTTSLYHLTSTNPKMTAYTIKCLKSIWWTKSVSVEVQKL